MTTQNIHFTKAGATVSQTNNSDACFDGYNACSWYVQDNGVSNEACYAGYEACKASEQPKK